ncbi:MAG: VCBS repeat-containing protein [Planctomycetaceae bacterium]|nr:VCBS repeat-containing protein [Planctomycetaceae bacterium]
MFGTRVRRSRRRKSFAVEALEQRVLLTGAFADYLGGVVIPPTPLAIDYSSGGIWLQDHFEVYGTDNDLPATQSFDRVTGSPDPVTYFAKLNPDGNVSGNQGSIYDATILDDGSLVYVGESDGFYYATEYSSWFPNATYWTDAVTPHQLLSAYPHFHAILEVASDKTWIETLSYGTLGDDSVIFNPAIGGYNGNRDISSDAEYIVGSLVSARDEFGFYDPIDTSSFDYSQVGDEQPSWTGVEVDGAGNYYLAGSYFDVTTFEQKGAAFWDIQGNFLGTFGVSESTFVGFGNVEGQLVAAVNVLSPETNEFEAFLVRLPDFQYVKVEDLIGQPAAFRYNGAVANQIFSSDEALGLILESDAGSFVTAIKTFDVPPRPSSVAQFNQTTGKWTVGHAVNGTFTQQPGPRWSTAVTWDTLTGDFNNDGRLDLAGRQIENGTWWIALDQGDGSYRTSYWGRWSPDQDFVDVTLADFNNDGLDDIAGRWTKGQWFVSLSTGTRFNTSYAGRWAASGWANVVSGDFNGDGMTDVAGRLDSGHWWFGLFNGSQFVNNYAGRWAGTGWQEVVAGDFNGDGLDDVAGLLSTGQWWQGTSTGTRITTLYKGLWTNIAGAGPFLVEDFDGDGRDDIAMLAADGMWYVNTARDVDNNRFTKRNWGDWSFATGWQVTLGDFNKDGLADIAGYLPTTSTWYVLHSQRNSFLNELYGTWVV